ncbi:hypothetical protein ACY2EW_08645 [Serratia nevei]
MVDRYMNGYMECGECGHQWQQAVDGEIKCPCCGSDYLNKADIGGEIPEWFNPDEN